MNSKRLAKTLIHLIVRLAAETERGREMDAGFDGGEWSGPEHDRIFLRRVKWCIAKLGLTTREATALLNTFTGLEPVGLSGACANLPAFN